MDKTFDNAEQARAVLQQIRMELIKLPYNNDLSKFFNNLVVLTDELSKLEVYTRRTPPRSRYHIQYKKKKQELASMINYLDNLMLIARLMV